LLANPCRVAVHRIASLRMQKLSQDLGAFHESGTRSIEVGVAVGESDADGLPQCVSLGREGGRHGRLGAPLGLGRRKIESTRLNHEVVRLGAFELGQIDRQRRAACPGEFGTSQDRERFDPTREITDVGSTDEGVAEAKTADHFGRGGDEGDDSQVGHCAEDIREVSNPRPELSRSPFASLSCADPSR
jgi:hypothetical protein